MDTFTPDPEATTEELMIVGRPNWRHERLCSCDKHFYNEGGKMSPNCALSRAEGVALHESRLKALRLYVAKAVSVNTK